MTRRISLLFVVLLAGGAALAVSRPACAGKVTLTDGRVLEGLVGQIDSVAEDPNVQQPAEGVDQKRILVVDDGLRRSMVRKLQVRQVNEASETTFEKISIAQRVAVSGPKVGGVGPIVEITPFDQYGRRIFKMMSHDGVVPVVQGMTEVTPIYTKVEGIQGRRSLVWEMRIATSSIPRDTLSKVLLGAVDPTSAEGRLKIVRLYVQSERYQDARQELEAIVTDFPDLKELETEVRAIRQMGARRLLSEIELRREAGQHQYTLSLLEHFPSDGVAGETLAKVKEIQRSYAEQREQGAAILEDLDVLIPQIKDTDLRLRAEEVRKEIGDELDLHTLGRLTAFARLADDEKLEPEQKVSLAVSGWLTGSDDAIENLKLSVSLYDVRALVGKYFNEPLKPERQEIISQLKQLEGSDVASVAKLVGLMKPPLETPTEENSLPGFHELHAPGLDGELDVTYYLQLPPEYNPHRNYPLIVTLNGGGSSPQQQIDWWAGNQPEKGQRLGQATRHGYIVLAVEWQKAHQREYQYSAREHYVVLAALRDACRRFAIDTDRVYLSGHSIGGDAAWDLGLAHPDLWAGVIPLVSVGERYCAHYWQNAGKVPFYFVCGEFDGDKMVRNAREFDRYLHRNFDTTIVEYRGRGHEHFYDEIQRLFDWMNVRRREFFPKDFECATMRPWDNFFWWVEAGDFPPTSLVDPASWPPARGARASTVGGKITGDRVTVNTAAKRVSLWLAPELIDFQKRNTIVVNGRRYNGPVVPDLEVLLDDVRGRGDRLHPFWAHVEAQSGR